MTTGGTAVTFVLYLAVIGPISATTIVVPIIEDLSAIGPIYGPLHVQVIKKIFEYANDANMFPNYTLEIKEYDDQCHGVNTADHTWEISQWRPYSPLIVGPTCTMSCSNLLSWVHLVKMHVLAPCHEIKFDNKKIFPGNIAMGRAMTSFMDLMLESVHTVGWGEFFLAVESIEAWTSSIGHILNKAKETGVSVTSVEVFNDADVVVTRLMEQKARIVVLAGGAIILSKFACAAYKQGFYGPNIIFIALAGTLPGGDTPWCSLEIIHTVYQNGLFVMDHSQGSISEDHITELKQNYTEMEVFLSEWENTPYEVFRYPAFDYGAAVIAMYKSIFKEIERVNSTYEQMTAVPNKEMYDLIERVRSNLVVGGATFMRRDFNYRTEVFPGDVYQLIGDTLQLRCRLNPGDSISQGQNSSSCKFTWRTTHGAPPRASDLIITKVVDVNIYIYIGTCLGALSSVALSVGIAGIQIKYWNKRAVKLSSPRLNLLILLGAILCVTVVSMHRVPIRWNEFFCRVRVWTFVTGFSLLYGALISKVYRVHKLFVKLIRKADSVKDKRLLLFILSWMIINWTVMTMWFITDPYKSLLHELSVLPDEKEDDTYHRYMAYTCSSVYEFYWIGGLVVLQGIMLTVGLFLAVLTRNVELKEAVDSRQVERCIYVVVACALLANSGLFFLKEQINTSYALANGIMVIGIILMQFFLFSGRLPFSRSLNSNVNRTAFTAHPHQATKIAASPLSQHE